MQRGEERKRTMPRSFPFSFEALISVWRCFVWSLVISVILFLLRGASALADGLLVSSDSVVGFLDDPSVYTNFLFGLLVFTYYLWLPQGIRAVIVDLCANDVLKDPLSARDHQSDCRATCHAQGWAEDVLLVFDRRRYFVICLALAGLVGITMGFKYAAMPDDKWYTVGTASIVSAQIWSGVLIFCIASVLLGCGIMVFSLRKMFRGGTNVRPLHPDGVGGLQPLARFALSLVYLISAVGVMLLAITPYTRGFTLGGGIGYTVSGDLLLAAIAYGIASPLVFFTILATASGAMSKAKQDLLARISDRWDAEYSSSMAVVESTDVDPGSAVKRLRAIRELHEATKSFPVWPFDGHSIRRFVASYLAPAAAGVIIDLLVGFVRS